VGAGPATAINNDMWDRAHALQTQSAEQIHNQDNQQQRPDDPDAPARTPSRLPVIAAATAEQQHQNYN